MQDFLKLTKSIGWYWLTLWGSYFTFMAELTPDMYRETIKTIKTNLMFIWHFLIYIAVMLTFFIPFLFWLSPLIALWHVTVNKIKKLSK